MSEVHYFSNKFSKIALPSILVSSRWPEVSWFGQIMFF